MSRTRRLDDALRSIGDAYVASRPADLSAVREAVERSRRRRRVTFVLSGAAMATLAVVLGVVVVSLLSSSPEVGRVAAPIDYDRAFEFSAPHQVDARGSKAFVLTNGDDLAAVDIGTGSPRWEVSLSSTPADIVSSAGSVWVSLPDEDRIAEFDLDTGAEQSGIVLPAGSLPQRLTVGTRALRVTVTTGVLRVDLATGEVRPLFEGAIDDIAMGAHGFWLLNDKGAIFAIHPDNGEPVPELRTDLRVPGGEITFARGAIWYARADDDALVRIDESTGTPSPRIELPGDYIDLDAGAGGPWVLVDVGSDVGAIFELDPGSGEPVGRSALLDDGPVDISTGAGGIWVTLVSGDRLVHVTP